MKQYHWLIFLIVSLFIHGCATGGTFPIRLQYQSNQTFSVLQQKRGNTLGIASFKDERLDKLYIGHHTSYRNISIYFKSDTLPLEKAIAESLTDALPRFGIKTVSVPNWDGNPESLKNIEADSVLLIEIKKFWIEGKGALFRTNVKTSIQFLIHLGVKKDRRVFARNIEIEKEMTVSRLTPERVEEIINKTLLDIFNDYFSNPYEIEPV